MNWAKLQQDVNRLFSLFSAWIKFIPEYLSSTAKDVTVVWENEDGTTTTQIYPNIKKQISGGVFVEKNNPVLGDGGRGSRALLIAKYIAVEDSNETRYFHIKTNIRTSDNMMFFFHIEGLEYRGTDKIVDEYFSGYAYSGTNSIVASSVKGSHSPEVYLSSDGYVTLRLSLIPYITTITVSSVKVGYKLITADDILLVTHNTTEHI